MKIQPHLLKRCQRSSPRLYQSILTTVLFVASSVTPSSSSSTSSSFIITASTTTPRTVHSTSSLTPSCFWNGSSSFSLVAKRDSTCRRRSSFKMTASTSNTEINPLVNLNLPSPLILGSGSFTRKLILEEMNIPFVLKVKPIDEQSIGDRSEGSDPSKLVMTLAMAKNEALITALLDTNNIVKDDTAISQCHAAADDNENHHQQDNHDKYNLKLDHDLQKECIVLTADQVVTHSTSILEKPIDIQQARDFVQRYGVSPPSTVGAVVMTHLPSGISVSGVDISTIHFKSDIQYANLVDKLVKDGAPVLSCAGGLMVEHPFVVEFIEKIDGTQDGVMGLSKDLVKRLLVELREKLNDGWSVQPTN